MGWQYSLMLALLVVK